MPGLKIPIRSDNIVTTSGGAKAVVAVPEDCNLIEIIVTGFDVYVALRDKSTNTGTSDSRDVANLDTDPETIAALLVAGMTVPYTFHVTAGLQQRRVGAKVEHPAARIKSRGFLHYKPVAVGGAGRLVINYYQ
jgi:hypothetical protein